MLRYAWITSAASPAVRGADSLVPPVNSIDEGGVAVAVRAIGIGERVGVAAGTKRPTGVAGRDHADGPRASWVNPPELRAAIVVEVRAVATGSRRPLSAHRHETGCWRLRKSPPGGSRRTYSAGRPASPRKVPSPLRRRPFIGQLMDSLAGTRGRGCRRTTR